MAREAYRIEKHKLRTEAGTGNHVVLADVQLPTSEDFLRQRRR